ncbi:MAG: ATP-binding cassette domain-containing protein, partial [Planctomycetales bacterium]|nr:ATP-binding cassette domain-containing protein [Planctomycetales bacterium]
MGGASLLTAAGLVKSYGARRVVDSLSFSMEAGEIVGLLGRNGAGKTTTFRIVVGLASADEGVVTLRGKELTGLPMWRRARLGMGYLPQEPSVFRRMSVEENLLAVLEARGLGRNDRAQRAGSLL